MSVNLSGLTKYVDEQKLPLIGDAITGSKTASLINLQTGIKYKATINILNQDVLFQDGADCGFTNSGVTSISQRVIETAPIKVNLTYCQKAFNDYYMNSQVQIKAGRTNLPFEEQFIGDVIAKVKAANEKQIWQGNKTGSTVNCTNFDGFLTVLGGEADVITGSTSGGTKAAVEAAYKAIPVEVLDKAVVFVGQDTFRNYVMEVGGSNLFYYDPKVDGEYEWTIPNTSTRIYGVAGLNGTNKIVAADPANLYIGCDLADGEEIVDFWWDDSDRLYKLEILFNMGVNVAFPDKVVVYTVA